MTKIESISLKEVEQKLHIANITDIYKVSTDLWIIEDDKTHKLDLFETLNKLGVDLTGLELVTCSTVGDWLTFDTRPIVSIYDLARRAVEERVACFPDKTVVIWEGDEVKVRVYRSQDQIVMDLTNGEPRLAEWVQVGYLTRSGWVFSLTQAQYKDWVKRARRMV